MLSSDHITVVDLSIHGQNIKEKSRFGTVDPFILLNLKKERKKKKKKPFVSHYGK